jgi:anti-sigma regulatory factor (Ser/Thr protein kinase)
MAREPSSTHASIRSDVAHPHVTAVFRRDAASVASAREWLAGFLDRHAVPRSTRRDAVLIISELVTNALRHGLGDIVVRGSLSGATKVQVSVTDSGPELPHVQPIDPDRVGGVGLHIVQEVAAHWGVSPFPGGKTVWATLIAPQPIDASPT